MTQVGRSRIQWLSDRWRGIGLALLVCAVSAPYLTTAFTAADDLCWLLALSIRTWHVRESDLARDSGFLSDNR